MIKTTLNTFIGGMNKDIDKSILPSDKYLDAVNYRLITTEGSTTGSLENIKGTKSIIDGGNTDLVNGKIVGSCQLRDDIILFVTTNTGATPVTGDGDSRIYRLVLNTSTETQTSLTLLYDDSLNVDNSDLNFSTSNPIKAIAKYETPNVQKIYWTDGYNNIRYANVASNLTVDGEAYVSVGDYFAADKFEYLPKITVKQPILKDIVGGMVNTGLIAYAYQLYITNGAETAFSPLSNPIHVVSDNDFLTNTKNYRGDKESINSGKGFTLEIDNTDNKGFERLRLIRVHYSYINSTPEIFIANEIAINTAGSIVNITDVGDVLGELTVDEFNLSSTELFKCQDIASKENKLFASNIEKSEFIVDDFDVRAVRFRTSDDTARVIDDNLSPVVITSDLANWGEYLSNHDGINEFNDPNHDGDANYAYIYQTNGTTLGAEGEKVKIDFETELLILDNSGNAKTFSCTTPTDSTDKSYKNYASPWKGGELSWQRDEVYRLFVVFGNDRAQVSDPKWICDLRMPSLHEADFTNSSSETVKASVLASQSGSVINTYRLYPRIYFKYFPANATYARIHRVKRERPDRFVVTQGLAIPSLKQSIVPIIYCPTPIQYTIANEGEIIKLVSPEINITKNISKQSNDYLDYVTNYSTTFTSTEVDAGPAVGEYLFGKVIKMEGNTRVPYAAAVVTGIDEAFPVSPAITSTSDVVSIDLMSYNNYDSTEGVTAKGCTGLIIAYTTPSWSAETVKHVIVNYKSNVYGSQYGGHTYEDRMNNLSIPCSGIIKSTDIETWVDINYGDTFINYFDVSTTLADLTKENFQDTWSETVYVPLESSINCDLRHDIEAAHMYPIPTTYPGYVPYLRQEYAGDHTMTIHSVPRTFNQTQNLYLYNTVYSHQVDVQPAISLVVDKILETEFDSMVKVSNNKSNGEITDSWTKFGINEFIEVDSIHGPINSIKTFNNRLFFFQDKAFGLLAVNDRSLITDNSSSQLVLGTGGVLDRYDYVSTIIGCQDLFSVVGGTTGLFWYDRINNYIIKYSDGIDKISVSKGIQSYLDSNVLTTQSVIAHPDINNNEIIFTFFIGGTGTDDDAFTIAFSENVEAFVSFYSFIPNIYIPYNSRYLTTTRDKYCNNQFNLNRLFLHDSDIYPRCNFYALTDLNATYYFDSTLKLLYNQDYLHTKTWDNMAYMSNVYDTSSVELYNQTIDSIRCYNDYQNTDYVDLVYNDTVTRRERTWTLDIPRNVVDVDTNTNPDIFDPANFDDTRTFRERLRDKYMITDLKYVNGTGRDKFVLSNVGAKYRLSYR